MIFLLSIHAAATWFMAGLIWFVQVVHYPLFATVGEGSAVAYAREHARRTSRVVGAPMLIELAAATALPFVTASPAARLLAISGLLALVLIWCSTAALQMPCHRKLGVAVDSVVLRRLVATNWFRTGLWSLRAVLAGVLWWLHTSTR